MKLKERVWRANQDLVQAGLVTLTFGNASEADPQKGVAVIKPSGVSYDQLEPEDMVVLSIETGERVEGSLNPSSDAPTHLAVYRAFPSMGGITTPTQVSPRPGPKAAGRYHVWAPPTPTISTDRCR